MPDRLLVSPSELFGDGVFETVHLRPSGPWLLDAHLDRLTRSAALLEIDLPDRAVIEDRVRAATAGRTGAEGALRILCTRESLHVTVSAIPEQVLRERRTGIRVVTADLGFALGRRPPWSLSAAKSLSYGPNFAARRWARGRGADDVLWHSTDGYVLEAPTASVVWLADGQLSTVSATRTGILPGTTVAALLAAAPSIGLPVGPDALISVDDLARADGVWLASALRGLAEVVTLDGAERARSPWTVRLLGLLGY